MPKKKESIVEPVRGRSTKGILALGISWGIAIVSLLAFGGLLIYVLFGSNQSTDTKKVLGANVNNNANLNVNTNSNTNANANTNTNPEPAPEPPPVDISKLSPISQNDYIRGEATVPVTLIEFADFQCPYCARHQETLTKILEEYKDKVRLVFRHFPLSSIHPLAEKSAEAAECAGKQGKFWEMHDKLFANQATLGLETINAIVQDLKLDVKKFADCFDSGTTTAKIQNQAQEAIAAGVTGTPGTFVNGVLVKGAVPYDQFKQIIEQALAQQ